MESSVSMETDVPQEEMTSQSRTQLLLSERGDAPSAGAECCRSFGIFFKKWISLFGNLFLAAGSTVFLVIGIVLFPFGYLVPSSVLNGLFRMVFKVGYWVYVFTPLGRIVHLQMVKSRRAAHTAPHTANISTTELSTCDIIPIPVLVDNYAFLIIDRETRETAVVDPSDPELVVSMVARRKLNLSMILTTHRHHDHAGGNLYLARHYPGLEVLGGVRDKCEGMTKGVKEGDRISLGQTFVQVIETPCHTPGHVVFLVSGRAPRSTEGQTSDGAVGSEQVEAVFSGDTLFIGGVGAFFHGDNMDMHRNLNHKLAWLPDPCKVFCGHEYTVENVRFAEWLEPGNSSIIQRANKAIKKRAYRETTLPSTMGEERRLNPFLRVRDPSFAAVVKERLRSVEKGSWIRRIFGRKQDAYLPETRRKASDVEIEMLDTSVRKSLPLAEELLPDSEAVKVMGRLQKLLGIWGQCAEHMSQAPPCCVHGTCARRVTCSGTNHRGLAVRTQSSQTSSTSGESSSPSTTSMMGDRFDTVHPSPASAPRAGAHYVAGNSGGPREGARISPPSQSDERDSDSYGSVRDALSSLV